METELLQAREAAAAIVDTARSRDADLVLIGMPYRKRMGRVYVARTVQDVYLGAHCAVLAYRQEEPQ
jgi:nucleotide-binding universal stress UspA family protein